MLTAIIFRLSQNIIEWLKIRKFNTRYYYSVINTSEIQIGSHHSLFKIIFYIKFVNIKKIFKLFHYKNFVLFHNKVENVIQGYSVLTSLRTTIKKYQKYISIFFYIDIWNSNSNKIILYQCYPFKITRITYIYILLYWNLKM